jgi:two-component system, NarL family, invasion response regulator UvrY
MGTPHPVLVVDDQAPFLSAARAVVRRCPDFEIVGEASNGPEAIRLAEQLRPDLILMDINMPHMSGIEATRRIVSDNPLVVVVLCSTYDVEDLTPEAFSSGARAYVNKERLRVDTLQQLWDERGSGGFEPH